MTVTHIKILSLCEFKAFGALIKEILLRAYYVPGSVVSIGGTGVHQTANESDLIKPISL